MAVMALAVEHFIDCAKNSSYSHIACRRIIRQKESNEAMNKASKPGFKLFSSKCVSCQPS